MKTTIDKALAEYTTKELVDFHANLNAIFVCVDEDFGILPLLMRVHFALAMRPDAKKYLDAVSEMFKIPA